MTQRRILDTNLIIRFLTQDNEAQTHTAQRLFQEANRGGVSLILLPIVLAECAFVLESFYKHPRGEIANVLTTLIYSSGIELHNAEVYIDALDRYRTTNLHFVDCAIASHAAAEKLPVATFDRDFRKFSDVNVDPNPP